MGVKSLADRLGIPIDEAQSLMDKYFAGLPSLVVWSRRQVEHGKKHGYVTSRFGRTLPIWEYQSDKRWVYQKGDRACVNYPAQGAIADYMKIVMVRVVQAISDAGLADRVHLVMNIHDALEFYVHRSVPPQDLIAILQPAVIFEVKGWPVMVADWHIFKKWGSPMKLEVRDDGGLIVRGEQTYELAPSVEVDEDTGEEVYALPEVKPEVIRQAVHGDEADEPGHRQVIVTLPEMPVPEAWARWVDLNTTLPGSNLILVRTPEGEVNLPYTTGLGPQHLAQVAAIFPGASVAFAQADVDPASVLAGLEL